MVSVYLNGKRVCLQPKQAIAKGGEADIFDLGQGKALKLFKPPNHPDYQGFPAEQQAAIARIAEHQQKLRQFPTGLPHQVVQPEMLATDQTGQHIVGYVMPLIQNGTVLLKYSDPIFRRSGISASQIVQLFQDLHRTLSQLHQAGVVVGDFNDLNVLVVNTTTSLKAYLIDADSFQFGNFLCNVFTARFVDPLLCDYATHHPMLVHPHSSQSDWYAFVVMLMQCLLFVDPYGGIYKPKDPANQLPHPTRPAQRITIFHPEVVYPKPAIPYQVLSDDLLHYFQAVLIHDRRGVFPISLLEDLHWQTCASCGKEHTRSSCPVCTPATLLIVAANYTLATPMPTTPNAQVVQGRVTAAQRFHTDGIILSATMQQGALHWIYYHAGQFHREDGTIVFTGDCDPYLHILLQGKITLLHKSEQLMVLAPGQEVISIAADRVVANGSHRYWTHHGQLLRDGSLGNVYVGDVLGGQTQLWVGDNFGFGCYQAGDFSTAFVFDAHRSGINDQVKLPPSRGQLLYSCCTFADDRCWRFTITQEQGNLWHRCTVIRANGEVEASAIAQAGDGSWLDQAMSGNRTHGHCAARNFLLVATDDGIMRIDITPLPSSVGSLTPTETFPDTEPFVSSTSQLFIGREGLYVVDAQDIRLLTIQRMG